MCNIHQPIMAHAPKQKFGYLDIKQSSKVRTRKLKSWRRRWIVLTQLSDLSSDKYVAKLDLYENETKWRNNSSDKDTFLLENVTSIKSTPSRTHQHAFEVVEQQPVLVMSGVSELESYSWILALQQIFTPEQIQTSKGSYKVAIFANEYSSQWNLSGEFTLSVSPTCVSLEDSDGICVISWALSTIMKFKIDKNPSTGQMTVLVIESGPSAPTGQSCFKFQSSEAQDILSAIKQSICQAQAEMQQSKSRTSLKMPKLECLASESSIQNLLDSHHDSPSFQQHRSDSENSSSAIRHGSSVIHKGFSNSQMSLTRTHLCTELGLLAEVEENTQSSSDQQVERDIWSQMKIITQDKELVHSSTSSHAMKALRSNSDYNEIKDRMPKEPLMTRRNSYACDLSGVNIERLRSVSAVMAEIKANSDHKPGRTVSFENDNDDKSDFDSAISSMAFSAANDDIPWTDMQSCKDWDCSKECDPFDRKKSRSTPDLKAYWKKLGDVSRFENDYEDLDELRCSVQRLRMKRVSDIPPALPARPLSLSFTSSTDLSSKTCVKKRRSFFRGSEKCSSIEINKNIISPKTCESMNSHRPGSQSDCVHSSVCKEKKFTQRTKSTSIKKNANKEELLGRSCWYIDDINNRIIPELQQVKRRSSDVTILDSLDPQAAGKVNSKTKSLPCYGKDSHKISGSILHTQNMIDNSKEKNNPEVRNAALKPILKSVKSKSSNPLINFFLDDINFESHPMVTGKLHNHSSSLSSNLNLLTKEKTLNNFPQMPDSSSTNQTQIFFHEFNMQPSTDSLCRSFTKPLNSFDEWNVDEVKNQYSDISRNICMSSFYPNQLPFHPVVLKHNESHSYENVNIYDVPKSLKKSHSYENLKNYDISNPLPLDLIILQEKKNHLYENLNFNNNHMAMQAKSEMSSYNMNNNVTQTADNFAFISCEFESLIATEKQVGDVYIQPNFEPLIMVQ